MVRTYRLADEPEPSKLTRWVVSPSWPLLGLMLGGAWLAWPWFAFNAIAVGSPTRRREVALSIAGFVAGAVLATVIVALLRAEVVDVRVGRYLVLGVVALKLGLGYWLLILQSRTFPVYEHFGGPVRSGFPAIVIALVIRFVVLAKLPLWLWLVLG